MRGRFCALAATVAALALTAPAAAAAGELTLRTIDSSRVPEVRLVVALPEVPATAPTFQIFENGSPVGNVAVGSAASATSYALVVDTSQSMKGRPLQAAADGAAAFLATVKPGDRVALYGFGNEVRTLAPFTDDPSVLRGGLADLAIDAVQGTALHDGILEAARGLAAEDAARRHVLVVLTDGDNVVNASSANPAIVTEAVTAAQAAVYAIGIQSDDFDAGELQALASATGGTYAEGSPRELEAVYRQVADDLRRTFTLAYGSSASGRVALTVEAAGSSATATYAGGAPIRVTTGDGTVPESITHATWSPAALALGALVLMLAGGLAVFRPHPRKTLAQRLAPYTDSRSRALKAAEAADGSSPFGVLRSSWW